MSELRKQEGRGGWYRPTPGRLFVGLLVAEGVLLLSERFSWFAFNERKGWTVLIAVAAMCAVIILTFLWLAASLLLRRRFQFGISSLLVLVLAVAVPCSWLAVKMQQAKRQGEAYKQLQEYGAFILYDFAPSAPPAQLPVSLWLRDHLGHDFFAKVEFLLLERGTDTELAHVGELSGGKEFFLNGLEVSDAGVKHLQGMTDLESLGLHGARVTDDGLKHLEGLVSLKDLSLTHTRITDAGLVHLKGLVNLEVLTLSRLQVTDEGLVHLKGLTGLRVLCLYDTQVTDEGVNRLRTALPDCKIYR